MFRHMAWFYWDPPKEAFTIPIIDHPIVWYGVLFVVGFVLAFFIINPIFERFLKDTLYSNDEISNAFGPLASTPKQAAMFLSDRLCWFVIAGTIIGARLGLVFFYDWPHFKAHPLEIFKVWHGGLASHGGFIGVMLALYLYLKHIQRWVPQISFLQLCDIVVVPTTLVCCFIRLGNFVNQEILGIPTDLPWAVLFAHPADGSLPIPRHPIQLYEAFNYLITFMIVWTLWKKRTFENKPGTLLGIAFILGFGIRFILEFWKTTQDSFVDTSYLQMGQLLSIPFILVGFVLVLFPQNFKNKFFQNKKSTNNN